MVKTETIIAVKDIQQSSKFYQNLFGCESQHGGETFEILTSQGIVMLCLHKWGEHDHPTLTDPSKENGNGLILFFRVDHLSQVFERAAQMNANIVEDIHYNENSLKNQFILRDLDNYYLIVSE